MSMVKDITNPQGLIYCLFGLFEFLLNRAQLYIVPKVLHTYLGTQQDDPNNRIEPYFLSW